MRIYIYIYVEYRVHNLIWSMGLLSSFPQEISQRYHIQRFVWKTSQFPTFSLHQLIWLCFS